MKAFLLAAALCVASTTAYSQTVVKHIQTEKSPIATGVWAGDTFYLSGQLASPLSATPPPVGTTPDYGDMKAQAASVLGKIQKALQDQGLDMKDVVKATVFMAADPKTGKLDFEAMNGEFVKYFGTKDQPNKPARSAFQVAALVRPDFCWRLK